MDSMDFDRKAVPEFIELVCQLESDDLLSCALSAQKVFSCWGLLKLHKFLY